VNNTTSTLWGGGGGRTRAQSIRSKERKRASQSVITVKPSRGCSAGPHKGHVVCDRHSADTVHEAGHRIGGDQDERRHDCGLLCTSPGERPCRTVRPGGKTHSRKTSDRAEGCTPEGRGRSTRGFQRTSIGGIVEKGFGVPAGRTPSGGQNEKRQAKKGGLEDH